MRLPVAEIEMPGDDLRRHHQHAPLRAGAHQVEGDMQAGGRRGAAERHVEGGTLRAERILDLDGDCRIGPLVMRGRADHHVDVGGLEAGMIERPLRRLHAELGHDRELEIVARRDARRHALRIENAVEHQHVALLHAGGVEDELGVGFLQQRLAGAGADGILRVDPCVEARDQFIVGDPGFGDFDPDAGNGRAIHSSYIVP